jgi:fumarate reductase subunit C
MDQLRFTIPEILSLIGITQCVYILVYMSLRAGRITRAGLPLLYFLALCAGFLTDFGRAYIGESIPNYAYIEWFAWFYGPPLSVLLIIQIAQITKTPALKYYGVLLLPPIAFFAARTLAEKADGTLGEWLVVSGLIAGALSLLVIWFNRSLFDSIHAQKTGKERYWLILALIVMNAFFLGAMLLGLNEQFVKQDVVLIRTVLGLGFVYLVSTSLFRIYPQAVHIEERGQSSLSGQEKDLAQKVHNLMTFE